jgi:hypothetical protein
LYNKPGPPTPGRNASLNTSGRIKSRKSLGKKNTPSSLQKILRAKDKENLSVLSDDTIVTKTDSPAARTRAKINKTNVFRNPFRGH